MTSGPATTGDSSTDPQGLRYLGLGIAHHERRTAARASAHGIPFAMSSVVRSAADGPPLPVGVEGRYLYLLGCRHRDDTTNPVWGGADPRRNCFLGERIGDLVLRYDTVTDTIPLLWGHSIWWREPYILAHIPLSQPGPERELLQQCLQVAGGIDGHQGIDPYVVRVQLRPALLGSLDVRAGRGVDGAPSFDAATVAVGDIQLDPDWLLPLAETATPDVWFDARTIDSADPLPPVVEQALTQLGKAFATYEEDVCLEQVLAAAQPAAFPGPRLSWSGTVEAEILTRVYADNAAEVIRRVDADGMIHESAADASHYPSFGTWIPARAPYFDCAYTRNRTITLATEWGYSGLAEAAVDFFDRWMMYFPQSYPNISLNGQPIRGHATVVANKPHMYHDELQSVGTWPTRYETRDFGNSETDGHGMLMLSRYRHWVQAGRDPEWIRRHWPALSEAAEFLVWALDNPADSFAADGVLYAETEGGLAQHSIYTNVPCYYGLVGYAEMASAAGRVTEADRWQRYADQLGDAIDRVFSVDDPLWGSVWDTTRAGSWHHGQGVLAPLLFAVDLFGAHPASQVRPEWRIRTERSYEMVTNRLSQPWCAPEGLGYGQNYYALTALVLDRMTEATHFLNWLARFCFAPRLEHPFRAPEGASIGPSGRYWRRWGDLGNLYQMADTVHTLCVLAGVTDLDPGCLLLTPRLPVGFSRATVEDWPIRYTRPDGSTGLTTLSYTLSRYDDGDLRLRYQLAAQVPRLRIRLGPAPEEVGTITLNGQPLPYDSEHSGDSRWVWVEPSGPHGEVTVSVGRRTEATLQLPIEGAGDAVLDSR